MACDYLKLGTYKSTMGRVTISVQLPDSVRDKSQVFSPPGLLNKDGGGRRLHEYSFMGLHTH